MQKIDFGDRTKYYGGSDLNYIMVNNKFKTPFELAKEKSGLGDNFFDGNIYTETGNLLESRVREVTGARDVDHLEWEKEYNNIVLKAHIDGISVDEETIIEIKVSSLTMAEAYETYQWQIRHYMYVTGYKKAKIILYNRNAEVKALLRKINKDNKLMFNTQFSEISDVKVESIKKLLHTKLHNYRVSPSDIIERDVIYDEKLEQLMLAKLVKFDEFVQKLKLMEVSEIEFQEYNLTRELHNMLNE